MEYRKLGQNGPKIPVIGFGGWPIGGGMGSVSEDTAMNTVREALDRGYTLIDTAQYYKSSEERIGKVIQEYDRDKLFITSKVSEDMSAEGVRRAFENSLIKLKVDYLDLYQIHWRDKNVPVEETLDAIEKFQSQGKIRYIGVSNFTVEQLEGAMNHAPIVSNQINYNLFLRTPEERLFPFCKKHGIGLMVHSTLAKGLLTGKYTLNYRFDSEDERSRFDQYQGETLNRYLAASNELKEFAAEKGWTLIQTAIAWVLRRDEVSTTLVGMKDPSEVEAPYSAADLRLNKEEIERIEDILKKHALENLSPFDWQIV